MNAATTWTVVGGVATLMAVLVSVLALVFRIGALTGTVTAFMATYERDRSDMLKDMGKLEERQDAHLERHHKGAAL